MKKSLNHLLVALAFSTFVSAQKNASKINLLPGPAFFMFGVSQEVKIAERLTMQTCVKYMPSVKFPGAKYMEASYKDQTANPFADSKITAFGNVTEFRIYGKEKKAFNGFYWGPYFTANVFKVSSAKYPGEFKDDNGVVYKADLQQVLKLTTIGGGLQIGVQKLIKNVVAIDWTILGIGFGNVGFSGSIEASNTSGNFDFRNYTADVNNATQGFEKVFPVKKTVEAEKVSLGVKVPYPMLRMGLSIGIAY